jgi:hypothetical protein
VKRGDVEVLEEGEEDGEVVESVEQFSRPGDLGFRMLRFAQGQVSDFGFGLQAKSRIGQALAEFVREAQAGWISRESGRNGVNETQVPKAFGRIGGEVPGPVGAGDGLIPGAIGTDGTEAGEKCVLENGLRCFKENP